MPEKTCNQVGCDRKYHAKGLCRPHYWAERNATPAGKSVAREAERRYRETPKGKEVRQAMDRRRNATAQRQADIRAAWRKYRASPAGKEATRRWAASPKGRMVATAALYRYKARKKDAGGSFTAHFGNKCWICGGPFEAIDHVKPVSKGGASWPSNLRPICRSCNRTKSNKWYGVARLGELVDG